MPELWRKSAVELAALVRQGKASAREVVADAVARLRAANPAVNAVTVDLGEQAMTDAAAADARQARGEALAPLHGVPITIKQNVDMKGLPNPNGIPNFLSIIAPDDAPVVANLRKAGAIIIGQTNTPEFSMRGMTENPIYGRTENPWDPAITCGGSSGGAGAAVALGIGAIAHGNDIGGSLRWPAHCNGVSTIRPTHGRIPAYNPSATAERPLLAQLMSTQGPMAREVRDVRLGLAAMSARDPRDPFWTPAPLEGPPVARPLKVAVAEVPKGFEVHKAVLAQVDEAARMLAEAGYAVEKVKGPDIERPLRLWFDLCCAEIRHLQLEIYEKNASPEMMKVVRGYFALGHDIGLKDYMAGMAERSRHVRDWMMFLEHHPVLLTPLVLQPSWAPDADLGGDEAVKRVFRSFLFQTGLNFLGLPAAFVPTGLHEGRPIGVQLVAGRFREDLALETAEAIESRVGILAHRLWERG